MDLLQEEQSGGVRLPLTRTHVQLQQTCATHTMAICKNRRCPSSWRSKAWMGTDWCRFPSKENQNKHPECESFRNIIFLLLSREWSYSLPPWKLPYTLPVMVSISFSPGEDKVDFSPREFDLTPDKICKISDTCTVCIKMQMEKEAMSSITQGQKITKRRVVKMKRNKWDADHSPQH